MKWYVSIYEGVDLARFFRESQPATTIESPPMPDMNPAYSSHVDSIGYDPFLQELHVQWQTGKTSIYHGVPPEVGEPFNTGAHPSIGEALKQVKANYRHSYK
jgi:hypothetical protein